MVDVNTALYAAARPQDPMDQISKVAGVASTIQGIARSKFDLALQQLGALRSVTASFLSDPDAGKVDITKRVQDEATKLAGMGIYSPAQVVQFLKDFPKDPSQQYKALTRIHAQTLSASEQLAAMVGVPQDLNTGPGTLTRQTPTYPGLPVRERGYVGHGLPPTTTVPNVETQQPEFLGTGEPPVVEQRPGSLTQIPPGAPRRALPPGSLRRAEPEPAPRQPQQRAPVPAAFPLGQPEASGQSAAALEAERNNAGTYQERVNPTRNAIEILAKMNEKDLGPGSEAWNKAMSAAQTWGLGSIAGVDPEKIRDTNKLRKYFEDAASRRAQGIGPKTNDGLASALTASPNMKLDRLSALDLLKVNMALDRLRQASILEFDAQNPPLPPGKFTSWRSKMMTNIDPRAFVYDLMTPQAQRKLVEGLSKQQREKFEYSLQLADKHGLLGDVKE